MKCNSRPRSFRRKEEGREETSKAASAANEASFKRRLTLNVDQGVPEVSNDHFRRVNSIDETRRSGRGRMHVGSVNRVDFRGDDSYERVDESDGDL